MLVVTVLGLGLLWAGAPARAQAVGRDEPIRTQPADPAPAPDPSAEAAPAQADEAPAAVAPPAGDTAPAAADAAQGLPAPDAEAQPVVTLAGAAQRVAEWVVASGDNSGRPFVIVDKLAADIFVFDADGRLQGAAPALVGLARGDDSAPGVGDRDLSAIQPEERTTPAGRFLADFGPADGGRTVLWVDYADAISLHPVVTSNPQERRLERLRSAAADDHRISYGCINVPADFYADVVLKAFAGGSGVVYILPDTRPLEEVFPALATQPRTSAVAEAADARPATDALPPPALELDALAVGADVPPSVVDPTPPAPDATPVAGPEGLAADPNDPPPRADPSPAGAAPSPPAPDAARNTDPGEQGSSDAAPPDGPAAGAPARASAR